MVSPNAESYVTPAVRVELVGGEAVMARSYYWRRPLTYPVPRESIRQFDHMPPGKEPQMMAAA